MARSNISIVEQHVEKAALGLSAIALLAMLFLYVLSSPYKTESGQGPSEICDEVARVAEETAQRVRAKPPQPLAAPAVAVDLSKVFGDGDNAGLIAMAGVSPVLGRIAPWSPPLVDVKGTSDEDKHELARLLKPERPVVTAGRSTFRIPPQRPIDQLAAGGEETAAESTRGWANVVAQIDLLEQGRIFRTTGYGPGTYELPIVAVHLQRREAGRDDAPWEDVALYRPYSPLALPTPEFTSSGKLTSRSAVEVDDFRLLARRHADDIARAKLPASTGGDPVAYPPVPWIWGDPTTDDESPDKAAPRDATDGTPMGGKAPPAPGQGERGAPRASRDPKPTRMAKRWLAAAEAAMRSASPGNLDLAAILLEAVLGEELAPENLRKRAQELWAELKRRRGNDAPLRTTFRRPEKMMPIVASDLDVIPGRAYVFRIRYEILNHYLGEADELKNPQDARRLTLQSDWSEPSAPVEVRPATYFFVTGVNAKNKTVSVTMFKYEGRTVQSEKATLGIGEEIAKARKGGRQRATNFDTGAIVVDVLADDSEGGGRLIYLDTADGRLYERTVQGDRRSPKFTELSDRAVARRG